MSRLNSGTVLSALAALGSAGLLLAPAALAEESAGGWRPTYDLIMLWINFAILVFVMVKFGRAPIRSFLEGQKQRMAREIGGLEKQKAEVRSSIDALVQEQDRARSRFEQIQQRIVEEGERRKQELIADAEAHSRQMIEDSKRKMAFRIQKARSRLQSELVDTAMDLASDRIAGEIGEADLERFTQSYLDHLHP